MKKLIFGLCLLITQATFAQNTYNAIIKSKADKDLLVGATVLLLGSQNGTVADIKGFVEIKNIPNGKQIIQFSFMGFDTAQDTLVFPLATTAPQIVFLTPSQKALSEVIITSTRSSRIAQNTPTRVEVIAADELEEEAHMKPGEIKKLLTEGTGIAAQQTSATSGISNIRIQGLDGRYTQLLRDGMPLYSGFSAGLSIMQIAPLDLRQVEFIKGSASTLYGGGAIGGLVNLISKTPQEKRELTLLLNGTSAKGFDGSAFYSKKGEKIGATIFGSYNYNAPFDPAKIGLTAIPLTNRFSINPKLFFYFNDKTTGWFGVNATYEDRYGGDLKVIEGKADNLHKFFERNKVFRTSTQLSFTHQIDSASKINFKNSIGYFDRKLSMPQSSFNGQQVSSFTEFNYSHSKEKSEWIAGVNLWTENFNANATTNLKYNFTTLGAFAQNSFKATEKIFIETGLRFDYNTPATDDKLKGLFLLPRLNVLFKINQHFTSRIGGGLGYKMPTPFSEEAETKGYQNIQPLVLGNIKAEQSYGLNGDLTYCTMLDEVSFNINQLFFYTYLNRPLIMQSDHYINAYGYILTKGSETNLKIGLDELNLYIGYTFTDTHQHFNGQDQWQPLTAKHRLLLDLTYEEENNYHTGIECNYVGTQKLSDGKTGKGYFMYGFLFEKIWKYFNLYINAENISDSRQTRWDTIYTGSITDPVFRDIYAPTDGIVINAGIKIKL
jgi:outer membrane receptor for ferrienterochelin and colicins